MKNTWLVWTGVIAVIVIVFSVVNVQKKKDKVPLSEIFPEEEVVPMDIDYEFVDTPVEEQQAQEAPAEAEKVVQDVAPTQETMKKPAPASASSLVEPSSPVKSPAMIGPYSIQVASFKDKSRADRVVRDVKAMGLSPVYVEARDLGAKGVWHRVYVGRFVSKSAAAPTVKKLKSKYKSCFVVKKKK